MRRIADGSHRFGMEFRFDRNNRGGSEIQLSGALDYQAREFPLDDDAAIGGWSVFLLRGVDADALAGQELQTLGELRDWLRGNRSPD